MAVLRAEATTSQQRMTAKGQRNHVAFQARRYRNLALTLRREKGKATPDKKVLVALGTDALFISTIAQQHHRHACRADA
jgi:hypothetical protein